MIDPPAGFVRRQAGDLLLLGVPQVLPELLAAGFDHPWNLVTEPHPGPGTGRGRRGIATLSTGERFFVKQALRGGFLARFNRERFFALQRFARELDVSRAAVDAGCPVVPTQAVALAPAAPGWRAWSAAPFVDDAQDLARVLHAPADAQQARAAVDRALAAVRAMHDGGLYHRDLNLGNILILQDGSATIIDLDRARFFEGGVPEPLRRRARARFLRSWRKLLGEGGVLPLAEVKPVWR